MWPKIVVCPLSCVENNGQNICIKENGRVKPSHIKHKERDGETHTHEMTF